MIGDPVRISLDPALAVPAYLLRKPGLQNLRSDVPPGADQFTVNDVDQNRVFLGLQFGFPIRRD